MALADRGRRNGWQRQATGLVTSHAALATTAMTVADRGGPLLKLRKPSLQVLEADATSEEIEVELARKLDEARAEIARLERRLSVETTAARALRERGQTSVAAVEAAEKRAE